MLRTGEQIGALGLHGQAVLLALPTLLCHEDLLGCLPSIPNAEGLAGSLGAQGVLWAGVQPHSPLPVGHLLTWKTSLAQVRKDSSCAHSSSPSPMGRMRSPPSSSSLVSTACAKAQKWGYARDPSPKTENLGAPGAMSSEPPALALRPGSGVPMAAVLTHGGQWIPSLSVPPSHAHPSTYYSQPLLIPISFASLSSSLSPSLFSSLSLSHPISILSPSPFLSLTPPPSHPHPIPTPTSLPMPSSSLSAPRATRSTPSPAPQSPQRPRAVRVAQLPPLPLPGCHELIGLRDAVEPQLVAPVGVRCEQGWAPQDPPSLTPLCRAGSPHGLGAHLGGSACAALGEDISIRALEKLCGEERVITPLPSLS